MATQPPTTSDAPFGMQPNIAAFIAYFFPLIGGIIMLVGGGTNKFAKWAAAQSIVFGACYFVAWVCYAILNMLGFILLHALWFPISGLLYLLIVIVFAIGWFWTWIFALQSKEVRLPVIADLTTRFFAAQL